MGRQCAWCRRKIAPAGQPVGEPLAIDHRCTHGICTACYEREMAKIRAVRGSQ